MMDEDALAEAYNRGLELEKAGDVAGAAAAYRQALAIDPDDHGGVGVRLAAMGQGAAPAQAPAAYVATLFDQHAEVFDGILVDQLEYAVPMMARAMAQRRGLGPFDRMLDLGCGTGLAAEAFEDASSHRTGVDLAEGMIEVSDEKELFDDLYVADAVRFVAETDENWDLIVATDVLPYLGDVGPLFRGVAARLTPGGAFFFSTETLVETEVDDWIVNPHHRYAHRQSYIEAALRQSGMALVEAEGIMVRREEGASIPGGLMLATLA